MIPSPAHRQHCNTEEPLQAVILHTAIETASPYQALSYVWGSSEKYFTLETTEGIIPLTASLHSALRRFRKQDSTVLLWADAVCINQNDNQEKSGQIRLMREIFGRASCVLAYLGEEADDSYLVPDLMKRIINANFGLEPGRWLLSSTDDISLPHESDRSWKASRAFFRRSWFRRVWILQEVAVATNIRVICGSWDESWELFEEALYKTRDHGFTLPYFNLKDPDAIREASETGFKLACDLIWARVSFQEGVKFPLLELLALFGLTEATRARDHAFALLGLAMDAEDPTLDPDYDSNLETIFTRYATFFIKRDQSLKLLCDAGLSTPPHRFPSWVPNWTTNKTKLSGGYYSKPDAYYHADKGSKPKVLPNRDPSILGLKGGIVDIIVKIGKHHTLGQGDVSEGKSLHPLLSRLRDCDEMLATLTSYPTGENLLEVYWRTLIRNLSDEEQKPTLEFEVSYKAAREYLDRSQGKGERLNARAADTQNLWVTMQPYMHSLLTIFEDMIFCITQKGYIGLVPPKTELGDVVSVLLGGPTAFILREWGKGINHYQLVGGAYIHGIMEGEALDTDGWREEEIFLH